MPRGRRPNYDARIQDLLQQLRAALLGREQARIEATVAAQMDGLVRGLGKGVEVGNAVAASSKPASAPTKKRRGWSPAAKAAARVRMKKFWAAKRGKGGKRGKVAKAATAKAM